MQQFLRQWWPGYFCEMKQGGSRSGHGGQTSFGQCIHMGDLGLSLIYSKGCLWLSVQNLTLELS